MTKALSHTVFSVEQYNQGSYVTIEGKRRQHSEFFIILDGDVEVQKINPETGDYSSQYLRKGDFFGVISAMTGLPELESVIALSPLKLIAVKRDKFGELIQKNPVLAMKIIRSYSLRLRALDKIQDETLGAKSADYSKENSLIQLALSYSELGNKNLASYMLSKYLKLYPNGTYASQAKAELQKLPKIEVHKNGTYQNNVKNYYPGEIIFCEGEPGDSLYVVMEGEVKITRNTGNAEITMNILNAGQIFGEMALLDNKPRSATAIANKNTKLAVVSKVNFQSTTELNPKLMTCLLYTSPS
ncbi:MAG: cyclic nucleotide-binding domain-containing protein, partial [Leptospiraceae bacterium]|nr:cyclic nucleotide-binding domain-containing protein [Leptospiraceae bacterium]